MDICRCIFSLLFGEKLDKFGRNWMIWLNKTWKKNPGVSLQWLWWWWWCCCYCSCLKPFIALLWFKISTKFCRWKLPDWSSRNLPFGLYHSLEMQNNSNNNKYSNYLKIAVFFNKIYLFYIKFSVILFKITLITLENQCKC